MIEKKYIVYEHLFPNGKSYIGITCKSPNARWENGKGYSKEHQEVMYNAIQKYGWDNIEHIILFTDLTFEEAKIRERELIKEKHTFIHDSQCNGYNMTLGGEGNLGHRATEKVIKANRERLLGKKGSLCPNSCPIICEDIEYESITDFCLKNNLVRTTVNKWLNGENKMPKEWLDKDLRFKNLPDKRQKEAQLKSHKNKLIYCGKTYNSQRELADFLKINTATLSSWLSGKHSVPSEIFINGIYKENGDKYNLLKQKTPTKTKMECDGIIFDSQRELAKYLGIKFGTLNSYLKGKNKMPKHLIDRNIKYCV